MEPLYFSHKTYERLNVEESETLFSIKYNGTTYTRKPYEVKNTIFKIYGIDVGCAVTLKNLSSGEIEKITLRSPIIEKEYRGMGGSYYGSKTETTTVCDKTEFEDYYPVSVKAPFSEKLLGKGIGDIVSGCGIDKNIQYEIVDIQIDQIEYPKNAHK